MSKLQLPYELTPAGAQHRLDRERTSALLRSLADTIDRHENDGTYNRTVMEPYDPEVTWVSTIRCLRSLNPDLLIAAAVVEVIEYAMTTPERPFPVAVWEARRNRLGEVETLTTWLRKLAEDLPGMPGGRP